MKRRTGAVYVIGEVVKRLELKEDRCCVCDVYVMGNGNGGTVGGSR
jgi:hypothetical protein